MDMAGLTYEQRAVLRFMTERNIGALRVDGGWRWAEDFRRNPAWAVLAFNNIVDPAQR